jgi:large subunit ribosomal protein L34e
MPRGMFKSRTFRRVFKKLPGGSTVTRFLRRKPQVAHCARCGAPLQGIPRGNALELKNMAKSMKRPERPYGGVLCSRCLRDTIKFDARD